jgi:hypothetical protein
MLSILWLDLIELWIGSQIGWCDTKFVRMQIAYFQWSRFLITCFRELFPWFVKKVLGTVRSYTCGSFGIYSMSIQHTHSAYLVFSYVCKTIFCTVYTRARWSYTLTILPPRRLQELITWYSVDVELVNPCWNPNVAVKSNWKYCFLQSRSIHYLCKKSGELTAV